MSAFYGNYTGLEPGQWIEYCQKTGQPLPDWADEYFAAQQAVQCPAPPAPEECPMPEPKPKRGRRSTKTAEVV